MPPLSTTEEEAMWTIGTGWWFMHLKQTSFLQQVLQGFPAIVFISVLGSSSFFFSDLFDLQDQTQRALQDSVVLAARAINLACTAPPLHGGVTQRGISNDLSKLLDAERRLLMAHLLLGRRG